MKQKHSPLLRIFGLLALLVAVPLTMKAQTYYAIHNKDKGYLKQAQGAVANDATFRYENAYDNNGSSIWVLTSAGYLQQEMYYLNVANGQTLILSTTPTTTWDLVADGDKTRLQMHGSTKILGLNDATPVVKEPEELTGDKKYKYAACEMTITEHKWADLKDVSFTVQSPQLVTYIRTYYNRNISVTVLKTDNGEVNKKVVDKKDSRCFCSLTYKTTSDTNKGIKWDIDETTGVIYNKQASGDVSVAATYTLAPLDPIVLSNHPASDNTVTLKLQASPLAPDATKDYLLFYTKEANYRFPYDDGLDEDDPVKTDASKNVLTADPANQQISWKIVRDDEGFYLFQNVASGRWLRFDESHYVTGSDYGVVEVGATGATPTTNEYRFRLYKSGAYGNNRPTYCILPFSKQWAVYKSDGAATNALAALNVYTSPTPKVISLWKVGDDSKYCILPYETEYRIRTDFSIVGPYSVNSTGNQQFTAETTYYRTIKGAATSGDAQFDLMIYGSENKPSISFEWVIEGLDGYISSSNSVSNGKGTLTVNVETLPVSGSVSGIIKTKATGGVAPNIKTTDWKQTTFVLFASATPTLTPISTLAQITSETGAYKLTADITDPSDHPRVSTFRGFLDGDGHRIKATQTAPLFTKLTNATVRNLNIDMVTVSGSGSKGAVADTANGSTSIYNVGLLGGTVNSSDGYCGGLVGFLDGTARVINCYSYANITGGTFVGGLVGYNNVSTTSAIDNIKTMVMNCMFYGDITDGDSIAAVYNGKLITNRGDNSGVSHYNYFRLEAPYVQPTGVAYNCALGAEDRFLQRFEFYRHLLNSHRELAGWWVTGVYDKTPMYKWVLPPDSIGTSHPYPVLMPFGKCPSVVNIDAENATTGKPRNQGGKLGTLSVTIQMGSGGAVFGPPTGAEINITSLNLNITDKDTTHFNYNYYKVQLPYYNDVGTKNYNGNRVVTGWKIVSITGGTAGTYSTGEDVTYTDGVLTATPYNFADRNCTNKDLYSVSKRVFNQGAYWDVPYGVTAITIEPYWAKCTYLADAYADVVYSKDMKTAYNVPNVGGGPRYSNGGSYSIAGEYQKVFTTKGNAIATSSSGLFQGASGSSNHTVYDYAVVLVGNYHFYGDLDADMSKPYTVTSVDLDGDNEPDYSYILRFDSRKKVHPVRVDFINIPGLGMAQKSYGGTGTYNFGIMQPKGWFESTNTALFRETQFEYDNSERVAAPYILQGGVMEQWVNGQSAGHANKTTYFHVGGNVWFKEFHRGTHQDQNYDANHSPVSVTGGDFDQFHLTGLYRADVTIRDDNAECYITGGRFRVVAGTGMDGIGHPTNHTNGNITWMIDNADIKEFYAGSFNADKPAEGNLHTIVNGGQIDLFCGGPKFGNMNAGRTVTTTATGCTFGTFFGAGYGGNSYSRQAPRNHNNLINFPHNDSQAGNDKTWNDWLSRFYTQEYNSTYGGVSTQFSYQFLPMSGNADNCARIFVEYVKFSLATTHTVTSTLTNCTITGNFYGGGSLGKVEGNVTSSLNNCTILGNVFGAGYSASLPDVVVDAAKGFEIEPYYYEQLGTYRKGVKYVSNSNFEPTPYNWEHGSSIGIDKTKHILYTTENLSRSNLGSISGEVQLTIDGGTIGTAGNSDTGNVYGGGDESYVTNTDHPANAKTTVTLTNDAHVLGNVYGGGNQGQVSGDSKVIIQ